jgi:hypothetical protein
MDEGMEGDQASVSDIDAMTATDSAAPEMDLSSIPDDVLEREIQKRRKQSPLGGSVPPPAPGGVAIPQEGASSF